MIWASGFGVVELLECVEHFFEAFLSQLGLTDQRLQLGYGVFAVCFLEVTLGDDSPDLLHDVRVCIDEGRLVMLVDLDLRLTALLSQRHLVRMAASLPNWWQPINTARP